MFGSMNYDEIDLQKVAALFCEGIEMSEIADILSLPASDVQQMIEHAEQRGHFGYSPRLKLGQLLPEVNEFVYNETLTSALRTALSDKIELKLLGMHITHSPSNMFAQYAIYAKENSPEFKGYRQAEYESLKAVAARAAAEVCQKLFDGKDHTIGVNWGISVKRTIDHIVPVPSQLSEARISVLSLFGDLDFHPLDASRTRVRSEHVNCNTHVAQLASRLGARAEAIPLNVPGFIPVEFARDQKIFRAIRSFLGSHASYTRIFGELPGENPYKPRKYNGIIDYDSPARITKMDTIVTGFGSADTYTDMTHFLKFWLDEAENKTLLRYCEDGMVVGDIAGHLVLSADGESDNELNRFVQEINRRILGAQPSDFVDVACRQRKTGVGGGVVGVAVGARKAKVIAQLLSRSPCPISTLVIDTHCALALLAELRRTEFRHFTSGPGCRMVIGARQWSADTLKLIPVAAPGSAPGGSRL